ncbi:hypothetical protein FIM10_04000 [Sphingomonadales bacterium 56]|uniref:phage tail protein n=1 Tax=unclassified Sphingobium TaxID=2611147 RepID=UPI00191A34F3|nr:MULTISPECIES: phage tail protein [unclassified Sphingobium]MBY2927838.1 hypothetical protein [Sphingomonadales bacterium 56]MBY2957938.1 hypothetical protein [Sphingomonadales bacterium 58]CAD7336040.1 hypothetical protein SPHS6_00811 [Sphingobium sp. S6]CAD7336103.1 hypothetical protein SPHS8_00851 [Sphingobium sp. S8]
MSKALRTVGMVVGAVALIAATAGMAAPAVAATATTAASAGGIAGISAATLTAIGTYGSLAAGVLSVAAQATAPGFSAEGSPTTFQTNPQSGLPYAIGRTRMSGLRAYARTYDGFKQQSKDDILAFVALLSIAGPIHSIEKFTADNELVTFAPNGDANGRFYRYMAQDLSLGNSPSTALALQFGGKPFPEWGANHKLSGIAHAQWALRFDTDGELYGAGAPEPAWTGKWVKVYDPRKDSTYPGGSGSHRALNEATYEWSDNPGLHALTWALGRWQNGKRICGVGAPIANIRVAEFVECANVCDANGWKVGGVEWTTDTKWNTLKRILQAGGAIPTQTGAMIGCLVSTPRTAIATIESRHLLDGLSISATKSRRDRYNTVIPRFVDEDSDWAVISGTAVSEPVYVTADGGQRTKEIDFPLVQVFSGEEATQPGQLAAYAIVNSREAGPFTWTTGPEWIGLKTGDVVYLNVPEEGLVNQPVLITRRAPDPATGKVSFAGETETYSKHAYALGQTTTPPAPFSLTAPDLKPAAPLALNWNVSGATSGEGLPALLVTGASEMPSADAVVIDYRKSGTEPWVSSAILSAVGPVSHTIAPLESATAYDVRIGYRVGPTLGNFTIFANVSTGAGKITELEDQLGDVAAGAAAPGITLSRPTVTLWAYENGVVTDFSNASGMVKVVSGGVDVTASAALSATATGCTGTVNTTTASPVAGQPKGYYRVTAMPGDTAKLTLTAVYGGKTVTAEFQLTKIRAGYQIVASTLPTIDLFEGRLVYRESDGKLYRYKGGAWTAAISGADIDNATLTTAKFAAGIEPVTIVTGGSLPITKSTNTIFYSGKLYRWNGSAYVATVQADEVTGKITSTQIDDNSIQTPHLAAGAVIASKMSIIPNNMCADPFFEDLSYWNYRVDQQSAWAYLNETGWASVAMSVPRSINMAGPQTERIHIGTSLQKCDSQGETFWLRAHGRNSTPTNGTGTILRCAVWFYGGDPLTIIGQAQVDFAPGTPNAGEIKSTKFTFPANCIYYRIAIYNGDAWAATGNLSISAIRLQKAADASLIVEGAVLAEHLGADSVIAGKVAAAAIGTRELVAKAATIEKLAIGSGSNIIPNSNFDTLDGWGDYGPTGYSVQLYRGSVGYGIRIIKGSGTGEAGVRMAGWGSADSKYYLPVNPGETYRVKCTVWRSAGNPAGNVGLYGRILLQDGTSAGTQIGGIVANPAQAIAYDVSGTYTIPANAVGIQFQIYYGSHADSAGGNVIVSNMSVTRMAAGELIIDGNVLAQHLGAGSVITDKLGAGAVTAAKVSVTQLSAITATIGVLRTATTGARMEIRDNAIKVFDTSNVLRTQVGNLDL